MKDKDREMAKAINAEFSDDDDEEDDNKSNWDDEEKVIRHYFESHTSLSFDNVCKFNLIIYVTYREM